MAVLMNYFIILKCILNGTGISSVHRLEIILDKDLFLDKCCY